MATRGRALLPGPLLSWFLCILLTPGEAGNNCYADGTCGAPPQQSHRAKQAHSHFRNRKYLVENPSNDVFRRWNLLDWKNRTLCLAFIRDAVKPADSAAPVVDLEFAKYTEANGAFGLYLNVSLALATQSPTGKAPSPWQRLVLASAYSLVGKRREAVIALTSLVEDIDASTHGAEPAFFRGHPDAGKRIDELIILTCLQLPKILMDQRTSSGALGPFKRSIRKAIRTCEKYSTRLRGVSQLQLAVAVAHDVNQSPRHGSAAFSRYFENRNSYGDWGPDDFVMKAQSRSYTRGFIRGEKYTYAKDYDPADIGWDVKWPGSSMPPGVSSDECQIDRRANLTMIDFIEEYVKTGRPVLIKGLIEDWPARKLWQRAQLIARHGDERVTILNSSNVDTYYTGTGVRLRPKQMRLSDYIKMIEKTAGAPDEARGMENQPGSLGRIDSASTESRSSPSVVETVENITTYNETTTTTTAQDGTVTVTKSRTTTMRVVTRSTTKPVVARREATKQDSRVVDGKTENNKSATRKGSDETLDPVDINSETEPDEPYLFGRALLEDIDEEYTQLPIYDGGSASGKVFGWDETLRKDKALFYVGGKNSYTFWHHHTHAFNSLVQGHKRWFLLPPFHGNFVWIPERPSMLTWAANMLERRRHYTVSCVQHQGEVLYIPSRWGHGTINLDVNVGIAVEVGEMLSNDY